MRLLCVITIFLGAASCQVIFPGKCDPKLQVVDNLDMEKYSGLWYEMAWMETTPEYIGDCVTVTYTLENSAFAVTTKLLDAGVPQTFYSTATLDSDQSGGKLTVKPKSSNNTSPFWVLATDYSNYALAYGCVNLNDNKKKVTSWIFTRTSILTPQSVLAMNDKLKSAGLDWDGYIYTNHTESACRPKVS